MTSRYPYWTLTKFIMPLAFTVVAQDVGEQALNRSLASSTNAVVELASFGIGLKIIQLFTGAVEDFKFVSVVLLKCQRDRKKILLCAGLFTIMALILLLVIGFTAAGDMIINDFHDVSNEVGVKARKVLYLFSLYPFLDSMSWVHTGILLRHKHSFWCGVGSILDVLTQVVIVISLLQTNLKNENAIYIPLIAAYSGVLSRLLVLLVAYYKYVHHLIPQQNDEAGREHVVSMGEVYRLWAPLMVIRFVQKISRPLINLFVARDRRDGFTQEDGLKSLAALTLVWPVSSMLCKWLSECRVLEATFAKKSQEERVVTVRQIRLFGIGTCIFSLSIMFALFWIPGVSEKLLISVSNVDSSLAALCVVPLKILTFLPIPIINRSLSTGYLLRLKSTSTLYPSGFFRLAIVIVSLIVLPRIGFHGATMGATTLLIGFIIDTSLVSLAVCYVKFRGALNRSLASSTNAVVELASFGIGLKIIQLFTGAVEEFKFVSVVLLKCQEDRKKILLCAGLFAMLCLLLLLVIGFTAAGDVIIDDFHDLSNEVGMKARKILYLFSLYPFIDAMSWVHAGILLRHKHSFWCGVGSIVDVLTQVVIVIILLQTNLMYGNAIYIPLIAAYSGVLSRLLVLLVAYYKYVHHLIPQQNDDAGREHHVVSFGEVYRLWAPLMVVRFIQKISRPLINLFVARDRRDGFTRKDGLKSLAALTLIWPISSMPWKWLNECCLLEAAFAKKPQEERVVTVRQIRLFGFGACIFSLSIMFALFWIPGVSEKLLTSISNVDSSLAALCVIPLKILTFLPIPIINRSLSTGYLLRRKATSTLYPSGFFRLAIVIISLIVLPRIGFHGAAMGATTLLIGFITGSSLVSLAVCYVKFRGWLLFHGKAFQLVHACSIAADETLVLTVVCCMQLAIGYIVIVGKRSRRKEQR